MATEILGIGLSGKTLTDLERRILRDATPYAIVLFGRNVENAEQLRELVREVKDLSARPPLIMMDEEGGRVDRLRHIVPGLPSAEAFLEGDEPEKMAAWAGRVIGMALRFFDIEVDLAPVVDIRADHAPKGLERRTFGRDPETVIELAGAFMRGLHAQGVGSCLKHWPGIGAGLADPHYGATVIDVSMEELVERDLVPFARLGNEAGAIMIGHGTYPQLDEDELPATLSPRLSRDLLRAIGFTGVAISDDMEMHAVSDLGSYEDISERALLAGNDVIMFCSHIERVPAIQEHLSRRIAEDRTVQTRLEEARSRADKYRTHCLNLRERGAAPVESLDILLDEADRFCDEFEKSRPHREVYAGADRRKNPRGRSGREEWT